MSLVPKDLTPVYKETIGKGAGARRWQRPVFVDHLPPCNHVCPAGENIQAWLALAQAGNYEQDGIGNTELGGPHFQQHNSGDHGQ